MPRTNNIMIKKLQAAINMQFGVRLLIDRNQWFSEKENRPVTMYVIKQSHKRNGREYKEELFRSYSQIQVVLFLRDYWYELNGWEVPKDNPDWEKAKEYYYTKNKATEETTQERLVNDKYAKRDTFDPEATNIC